MRKIAFYSEPIAFRNDLPEGAEKTILELLKADEAIFLSPRQRTGFDSGIDWKKFAAGSGVAIVLFNVNDACSYGIKLEGENAGLEVYEYFGSDLLTLKNAQVVGKESVPAICRTVAF